jgi:hypothetical protein
MIGPRLNMVKHLLLAPAVHSGNAHRLGRHGDVLKVPARGGRMTEGRVEASGTRGVKVVVESVERREAMAVAGFLAGYTGTTQVSHPGDLRSFASWCHEAKLTLFSVPAAPPGIVRPVAGGVRADAFYYWGSSFIEGVLYAPDLGPG